LYLSLVLDSNNLHVMVCHYILIIFVIGAFYHIFTDNTCIFNTVTQSNGELFAFAVNTKADPIR